MNHYQFEKHLKMIEDPMQVIQGINNLNIFSLHIKEHNLIIQQPFKVATSAMEAINKKILRPLGLTTTIIDNRQNYYNLLNNEKPQIWRLFRDPLCRLLSAFNFSKKYQYHSFGINWDISNIDPYMGQDPHFIPQTGTLPAYIDDDIYQSSLTKSINDNQFFDNRHWCYDNLPDIKLYENIEYFWLNEKTEQGHNVFDFILEKLDINTPTKLTVGDQNIDLKRIDSNNYSQDRVKSFDKEVLDKICIAYEPERQFLKTLTWQNMEPVFYGLS